MAKQDLGYVVLQKASNSAVAGERSTTGILNKIAVGVDRASDDVVQLLVDYVMQSDYRLRKAKKGMKLSILNRKYHLISVGTNNRIPYVTKSSLTQPTATSLEVSITFDGPIGRVSSFDIYFKKTSNNYVFEHAQYSIWRIS